MGDLIQWFQTNWVAVIAVVLAFHTFLKAVRDAIDKTPETDDSLFEKFVTIVGKVVKYITTGKRVA